jgi:glucose-1-phosphate cytidylyltransferase
MRAVILAGGLGSRISEETYLRPKPMVTVGNKPILWHIMKKFSNHGINDFVVCLGYKGEVIKEYFLNFKSYNANFVAKVATGEFSILEEETENWNVTLVDTGMSSKTGERLKRVKQFLAGETFFFTYGDGLTSQDLNATSSFHFEKEKMVTLTAVKPPARYGAVTVKGGLVASFSERTSSPNSLINGGFFVVNPEVFSILDEHADPSWELDILPRLAKRGDLSAFEHTGFWFAMDTLRDKEHLEELWETGSSPWLK